MQRQKSLRSISYAVFAVFFGCIWYILFETSKERPIERPSEVQIQENIAHIYHEKLVLVKRAIDGDTIELAGGLRVRLIGIDTPELERGNRGVECFGVQAADKIRELVEGKYVRLVNDVSEFDRYGRVLRYVYVVDFDADTQEEKEIFVNLEIVREGYAYAATFPPDVAHQREFLAAQKYARENNLGLWKECRTISLYNFRNHGMVREI